MFRKNAVEILRKLRRDGCKVSILRRSAWGCHYEFSRGGYNIGTIYLFTCVE